MGDKYDDAVAYLMDHPEQIAEAWADGFRPSTTRGAELFQAATPSGLDGPARTDDGRKWCGCLTQIRRGQGYVAYTPELTKAILNDDRIPIDEGCIRVEHLPVFAEWQRRIDKELCRT